MRKLTRIARLAVLAAALILLPNDLEEGRLAASSLCASETGACTSEAGSHCTYGGQILLDAYYEEAP